jgi:hypothetical protein
MSANNLRIKIPLILVFIPVSVSLLRERMEQHGKFLEEWDAAP